MSDYIVPQNSMRNFQEIYHGGECSEEATCKECLQVRIGTEIREPTKRVRISGGKND